MTDHAIVAELIVTFRGLRGALDEVDELLECAELGDEEAFALAVTLLEHLHRRIFEQRRGARAADG